MARGDGTYTAMEHVRRTAFTAMDNTAMKTEFRGEKRWDLHLVVDLVGSCS
jgi:hypothetical protein